MPTTAYVTIELVEVEIALNLANDPFQTSVNTIVASWNGRTGTVLPLADDYTASLILNDSSVSGDYVDEALDWLAANGLTGGGNLTTQYRMVYVESAGTVTESTTFYTDAGGDLTLDGLFTLEEIQFDLAPPVAHAVGRMHWSAVNQTLEIGMPGGNVFLQVGQEGLIYVQNVSGADIPNGKVVYATGAVGNVLTIDVCDTTDASKLPVLGMATEDIPNNASGFVALWGVVRGTATQNIDTSAFITGETLYLSTSGDWTNSFPSGGTDVAIEIGIVQLASATVGEISLNIHAFALDADFDGTVRYSVHNTNTGTSAATGFTAVNNAGYRSTFGIGGTNNTVFPSITALYGPGYGDNYYAVDGNKSHKWFNDPTDSHDFSSLNYLNMELDADGDLTLPLGGIAIAGTYGWSNDLDTYINNLGDRIAFTVGGLSLFDVREGATNWVKINGNLNQDVDFHVGYNGGTGIFMQGSDGFVGLGTITPSTRLHVTGVTTTDAVQLNTSPTVVEAEGMMYWNDTDYTLNLVTGLGPVQQVGQEDFILVHNGTGGTLLDGTVCYPVGASGDVPSVAKASAHAHETCPAELVILTQDIDDGQVGFAIEFRGKLRGQDTNSFNLGDTLYLDPATPATGGLTNVRPEFPDYVRSLGGVVIKDPTDGVIQTRITGSPTDTLQHAWDGCFRETIDLLVASDGVTITASLTSTAGLDHLTMMFGDGLTLLDVSPAATVTLTPGSATIPQANFIYIPKSTKVLTVSTSDWPTTVEHIRVAKVSVLSAAITEEDGPLTNQNWNDHVKKEDENGHLLHITEALREKIGASWYTGCELTAATDGTSITLATTAGQVYQIHRQSVPIMDTTPYTIDAVSTGSKTFTISGDGDLTSTFTDGRIITVHDSTGNDGLYTIASTTWSDPDFIITVNETIASAIADGTIGDDVHIVNDSVTPYKHLLDLADQTTDASGNGLLNTSYSVVIWGVANKTGQATHLMANMPTDTYSKTSPANAVTDALNYSVYDIPSIFNGVGFLIARVTFVNNSGTISVYDTQDLRGLTPSTAGGGGGGGGGVTTFLGLTDTPSAYTGQALNVVRVNAGETGLEFTAGVGDLLSTNNLSDVANAATSLSNLGGQPLDAGLTSIAALTTAADKMIYTAGSDNYTTADLTAYGRSIVAVADEAAFKALTNLEIGTDVQAYSAALSDIAGLALTDGNIIVGDGANWVAESGATARASLDAVGGRSALTTNYLLKADASGDAVNSTITDDGTTVSSICTGGVLHRYAANQDGIALVGRNGGGPTPYQISLTPATLTSSSVWTFQDTSDTVVGLATSDTLTNKTLTSAVLTTPQIDDTSGDHQYIIAVNELTADRTVTLPLLTGNDTFVFADHVQTLTNKTVRPLVNAQTGTSYTFVAADAEKIVTCTNASAVGVTIPPNSSVAFATNTTITVLQGGAGTVTVTGGTGVTVNGVSTGGAAISAQYSGITLLKTGTDTWIMFGDHGAVS